MLKVTDLDVHYGGIHALRSVSLHIEQGEIVSIIGANGAGKSTLLKTIAGVKDKSGGSIEFLERSLPSQVNDVVRQGISLVPEGRRVFPNLTVQENLMIGAYLRNDRAGIAADLDDVFRLFPRLKERIKQPGGTLSGGEQQMLVVGRALMSKPRLLLLDEPSLGLAPIIVDELFAKIVEINRERGVTVMLVEQNAFVALEVAQRAYVLEIGEVRREGAGSELLSDPSIQEAYLGISK
jgi:branched-chain amino acid transport system ATP-binding protein